MYVTVFFAAPPGELRLIKNIGITIENSTIGPPVNASLEAFNNKLIELICRLTPYGNKFFISFDISFVSSIENETANSYVDIIIREFLKIFGLEGLKFKDRKQEIQEARVLFRLNFECGENKERALTFAKYVPTNGFGKFIEKLIEKHVPGSLVTGLTSISYRIKKVGFKLIWDIDFFITVSSELLPWDVCGHQELININELLSNDGILIDEPHQNQRIIILIEQNHTERLTKGLTNYTVHFKNIQPDGYVLRPSTQWPNWVEIRYEPLFPMENIVIEITVNSYTQTQTSPLMWIIAAVIVIVVLSTFMTLLFYVKEKRKGGEKLDRKDLQ